MTELEDYQDYIQRSHNAFCKIVIRHAAIDIALRLRKQWEKELSLEYLMFEKFVPFSTTDEYFKEPEPCEEYPFTVCGQTVIPFARTGTGRSFRLLLSAEKAAGNCRQIRTDTQHSGAAYPACLAAATPGNGEAQP